MSVGTTDLDLAIRLETQATRYPAALLPQTELCPRAMPCWCAASL
jgi:hypothetical protein